MAMPKGQFHWRNGKLVRKRQKRAAKKSKRASPAADDTFAGRAVLYHKAAKLCKQLSKVVHELNK